MNHSQKGFIVPFIIAIIAILSIGGGVYVYQNTKVGAPVGGDPIQVSTTTPFITVTYPNGGEKWNIDREYSIIWTYNAVANIPDKEDEIYIGFRTSNESVCWTDIKSTVGAGSVKVIPGKVVCGGNTDDKSRKDFLTDLKNGGDFKVQVGVSKYSDGRGIADYSDSYFSIIPIAPIACTMDAMMCSDGTYVGRSGPKCEFVCQNVIIQGDGAKIGQTVIIEGIKITPLEMVEDSRCPVGDAQNEAVCVWAGTVKVKVRLENDFYGKKEVVLDLDKGQDIFHSLVTLTKVFPVKTFGGSTNVSDYKFSFKVNPSL